MVTVRSENFSLSRRPFTVVHNDIWCLFAEIVILSLPGYRYRLQTWKTVKKCEIFP